MRKCVDKNITNIKRKEKWQREIFKLNHPSRYEIEFLACNWPVAGLESSENLIIFTRADERPG